MTTRQRPLNCPEGCRKAAESSAREAVGDGAPRLIACLDKLKSVVDTFQWTPRLNWSEAHAYAPAWNLLRDLQAKKIALRDGESQQNVWEATFALSTRARRQRALNNLRRPGAAHQRSRFHRFLVEAISARVREIRGKWPSYSTAAGYGGKDVLRIKDWLNWLFCPRHPQSGVSDETETIVKCLKALRRGQPHSSRNVLEGKLHVWAAYQLLLMAEADFAAVQRATGERSDELRAIRAARRHLSPHVRKFPLSLRGRGPGNSKLSLPRIRSSRPLSSGFPAA